MYRSEIWRQLVVNHAAVGQFHNDQIFGRDGSPGGGWGRIEHFLRAWGVLAALLGDRCSAHQADGGGA